MKNLIFTKKDHNTIHIDDFVLRKTFSQMCFVVIVGGEKFLVQSSNYIIDFNSLANFHLLSTEGFSRYNISGLRGNNISLIDFLKRLKKKGCKILAFDNFAEMCQWFVDKEQK